MKDWNGGNVTGAAIDETRDGGHFRGADTQRPDRIASYERGVRDVLWKSASEEMERRGRLEERLTRKNEAAWGEGPAIAISRC